VSVVAWDGSILAADGQLTESGCKSRGVKIRRGRGGAVLAWVGGQSIGQGMARWFDYGAKKEDFPECQCGGDSAESTELIVALSDRTVWIYEHTAEPIQVHEPYAAWGSGAAYALGALAAGKNAREAVEIASQFDVQCGFGVKSFVVKSKK